MLSHNVSSFIKIVINNHIAWRQETAQFEDQWIDLECLYKACQAAITDGGLITGTGVKMNEVTMNDSENDSHG